MWAARKVFGNTEEEKNGSLPSAYLLVSAEPRHSMTARDVKFSDAISSRHDRCGRHKKKAQIES